jgi:hypothetical protein
MNYYESLPPHQEDLHYVKYYKFVQFISSKIKTFHALNFLKKVISIKEIYLFYRPLIPNPVISSNFNFDFSGFMKSLSKKAVLWFLF